MPPVLAPSGPNSACSVASWANTPYGLRAPDHAARHPTLSAHPFDPCLLRGGNRQSYSLKRAPPLLACRQVIPPAEERRAAGHRHRSRYSDPLRSDLPGSMATRCLVRFGCDLRHLSRLRPAGGLCAGLRRRHPRRVRPFRPPRVPPSLSWCVRAGHQEAAVGEAEGGPGVFGWCRVAGRAAIATGTEHHTAGGPVREGMTRLASVPPALGPSAAGGGVRGGGGDTGGGFRRSVWVQAGPASAAPSPRVVSRPWPHFSGPVGLLYARNTETVNDCTNI